MVLYVGTYTGMYDMHICNYVCDQPLKFVFSAFHLVIFTTYYDHSGFYMLSFCVVYIILLKLGGDVKTCSYEDPSYL